MHIHILGICGTFMGGLAVLAKQAGHRVTGSDQNVYPPMSTQLEAQGIELIEGYDPAQLNNDADVIIIGNTLRRGLPIIEKILNEKLNFTSGPAWLAENVLSARRVIAVSGTHGKTTASSMIAWILQACGHEPGFLIGGVPAHFNVSARLGCDPFFVIEADEYDSAFFDKRSKFVHYFPEVCVINNLEFDHADIFENLKAIQKQFHHMIRCVPDNGAIITQASHDAIHDTLAMGVWSPVITMGEDGQWQTRNLDAPGSVFEVLHNGQVQGRVDWALIGQHNVQNGLSALVAAVQVGVPIADAIDALSQFQPPKRRLEVRGVVNGVTVYDDFAHHPTAIASTLSGLRAQVGAAPIVAILECESNTMRMGFHTETLAASLGAADEVILMRPKQDWGMDAIAAQCPAPAVVADNVEEILTLTHQKLRKSAHVVLMSNKNFAGLHDQLLHSLEETSISD